MIGTLPPIIPNEVRQVKFEQISDKEVPNATANHFPGADNFTQPGEKGSWSPIHGSDNGSPSLEVDLPSDEDWPDSIDFSLHDDPLSATELKYQPLGLERPRASADWLQVLQQGNKRYPLRDTDRNTFRGSGFQDLDKSGDFCPDEKPERLASTPKTRIPKTKRVQNLGDAENDGQFPKYQQPKTLSYEQGRRNGSSMILRLNISSATGKEKFKALTAGFFLSTGVHDEGTHEDYQNSSRDSAYGGYESSFEGQAGATIRRSAGNVNEKTLDHPYQNSEGTYENLLGHPEARGCRGCYDLGLECSLIDGCLSYPCGNCLEDEQDCILITPRNEKQTCEHCKRKRLRCSHTGEIGEDSSVACDNCQHANVTCIAGPAKSYRMDDVLADKGAGPQTARKTHYSLCTKCCKNRIRTDAGNPDQNRRCRQCLNGSSSTTDVSPVSLKAENKMKPPPNSTVARTRVQSKPSTDREVFSYEEGNCSVGQKQSNEKARGERFNSKFDSEIDDRRPRFSASVPGGKVSYIMTSFCHPIQFNWVPPPPLPPSPYSPQKPSSGLQASSFPCHFCTNPGLSYGIAGLGMRAVQVIRWLHDDTAGYEELEHGWSEAGQECTRMCAKCTLERVMIFLCPSHLIRPIKGLDVRNFDYDGAMQGLVNQILSRGGQERDQRAGGSAAGEADVKWCSICPAPAFFECCVRPPYASTGFETSPSHDIGCGLLLCEVCSFRLTGRRHGCGGATRSNAPFLAEPIMTLGEHIAAAARDSFHYHDGLRADACFLADDSELMRRQGMATEDAHDDSADDGDGDDEMDMDDDLESDSFENRGLKRGRWGMGSPIDLTQPC